MKATNMIPTEVTYNTVIYACSRRRDMYGDALSTLGTMKSEGYAPDFKTLSIVLHASAVNGDTKSAERLFQVTKFSRHFSE
jgi:pentatricopeptide repeat protein